MAFDKGANGTANTVANAISDDELAVVCMHGGDDNSAAIIFEFNGERIAVSVTENSPLNNSEQRLSPEGQLIHLINEATLDDVDEDPDHYESLLGEIFDIILGVGRDQFRQVASTEVGKKNGNDKIYLHALLYPKEYHFAYRVDGTTGNPNIVSIRPDEAIFTNDLPMVHDFDEEDDNFQALRLHLDASSRFSTQDIQVVEILASTGSVTRVRVPGTSADLLCKATGDGALLFMPTLRRELECLLKLQDSDNTSIHVRTPSLAGVVTHPDTGYVIGLLRQWIPGMRLSKVLYEETSGNKKISRETKKKWAMQICDSVNGLHRLGLVWGDGKPSNIIISNGDKGLGGSDAWLIDFGGGRTNGWVDADLEDTVEGDKQAVDKILAALRVT